MKDKKRTVEKFLTVKQPESERDVLFKVLDKNHLILLEPETHAEMFNITISETGEVKIDTLMKKRWPDDAGKCLLQCASECNGDLLCVAECAALCSTIIIG